MKRFMAGFIGLFLFSLHLSSLASEKWQGVDEAVVQKIAAEHGHQTRPLLGLEGDIQLFAFLMAGVVGGFAAGYFWRMLLAERKKAGEDAESTTGGGS
jgi:hypothetical protein